MKNLLEGEWDFVDIYINTDDGWMLHENVEPTQKWIFRNVKIDIFASHGEIVEICDGKVTDSIIEFSFYPDENTLYLVYLAHKGDLDPFFENYTVTQIQGSHPLCITLRDAPTCQIDDFTPEVRCTLQKVD